MKICSKCSASFEDDAAFCPNCGSAAESEKSDAVIENPSENETEQENEREIKTEIKNNDDGKKTESKFTKKYLPFIIGAAAVVLIIIIISIFSSGGGYKSVVSKYEKFINGKCDEKFIEKLAPEEYWEAVEDNYDADVGDVADALEKFFRKNELYGIKRDEIKYSVSAAKSYKLSDKLLDTARKALKDNYDISKKDVSEARGIVVDISVKFDIDEADKDSLMDATALLNSGSRNVMYAAKINGKWYLFDRNFEAIIYNYMFYSYLD